MAIHTIEEEKEEPGEDLYAVGGDELVEEEQDQLMLSINAVEGSQEAEAIKLLGVHRNKQLVILIESGSTSSFLDKRIATQLKLPLVDTPITSVTEDHLQLQV